MWSDIRLFIALILGALLTFGSSYLLERRRERRSIRAAARLVQQEFMDGMLSATAGFYLSQKNKPIERDVSVEETEWLANRAQLAEAIRGAAWSELTWATTHRREFIDWLAEKRSSGSTLFADDYTETKIDNLITWGNRGFDALNAAAGIPWRKRRQLRRERERDRKRAEGSADAS